MRVPDFLLVPLMLAGLLGVLLPFADPKTSRLRAWIVGAFVAAQLNYLVWRLSNTLPVPAWNMTFFVQLLFLIAELCLFYAGIRNVLILSRTRHRSGEVDALGAAFDGPAPLVDVLIPTYNESTAILEKTVVAALALQHPRLRVWLLDDGRRAAVSELAERFGIRYLTRPNNFGAKAGNLNHALDVILREPVSSDFLAVFDADFIARPEFVRRTLPLMRDTSVAIVQSPQFFYNADPLQFAFRSPRQWPDVQRLAFDTFMPARDARGSAYCCGTSFLARTSSIAQVGGFPTESVTEDVLLSRKLKLCGLKTIYLDEFLSAGLAAEGLSEFLTQRGRWALGLAQTARAEWHLLRGRKSLWARIHAVEASMRWGYVSAMRIFLLLALAFSGWTDVPLMNAPGDEVLAHFLPPLVIYRSLVIWVSRGAHIPIVSDASSLLASVVIAKGTWLGAFSKREQGFKVTDKGVQRQGVTVHWHTLGWLLPLLVCIASGLAASTLLLGHGRWGGVHTVWSWYTILSLLVACGPCIEAPNRRGEHRLASSMQLDIRVSGQDYSARMSNVALSGAELRTQAPLAVGTGLLLALPDVGWVRGQVAWRRGERRAGVEFLLSEAERVAVIRWLYVESGHLKPLAGGGPIDGWFGVLLRVCR